MATRKTPAAPAKPSTSVAVRKPAGGNIVSIQEQLKAQAVTVVSQINPGGGPKIRVTKTGFELPDGSKATQLELVILDFITAHSFYDTPYDPKNPAPPACFARGRTPKDLAPSKNSPNIQADDCQNCPMNEFGSSGNGKACTNNRVLAVLPPDADADTPIWTLSVSPTALKAFDGYVAGVVRAFGMPPISVITTVGLNPATDFPQLTFSNPVPNSNLDAHFGRQAEAVDLLMVEPDVSGYQPPSAKRGPAKKAVRR